VAIDVVSVITFVASSDLVRQQNAVSTFRCTGAAILGTGRFDLTENGASVAAIVVSVIALFGTFNDAVAAVGAIAEFTWGMAVPPVFFARRGGYKSALARASIAVLVVAIIALL